MLKIIEPKALPTAKLLAPLETEKIDTKSSGIVVPMLTMVAPITAVDILNLFAIATAESTSLLPPKIISASDVIKIKIAKIMFVNTFYYNKIVEKIIINI